MDAALNNLVTLADGSEQIIGLIVLAILSLLGTLAERAKKRSEQRQQQAQREEQVHHNAPAAKPPAPPAPTTPSAARRPIATQNPARRDGGISEIVQAMREAARERATEARREGQQAQQRARETQQETLQQARQRAQETIQQRRRGSVPPAQRPAMRRPPRTPLPPSAPAPEIEAPRLPHQPVSQREMSLGATGHEVDDEVAHLRARLTAEEQQREQRLTQHGGLLHPDAQRGATAPAELLRASLDASELRRAVIYSEILGKPLAIRQEAPAWESF